MMKQFLALLLAVAVSGSSITAFAQGSQYKVRYKGGTLATTVKDDNWNNLLTITFDEIRLQLKDGQQVVIDTKKVNSLSHGEEATRRVKTYAGVAVIVPFVMLRLSPKGRKHYVGIEYTDAEGRNGALLLQAKNDSYRALLFNLKGVTGKEVQTEDKEKLKEK